MLGSGEGFRGEIAKFVDTYIINSQNLVYMSLFALLIIAFAYFYNSIAFDPIRQADQIRRQGGFIPGVRPGPQTERYLAQGGQPDHAAGRRVRGLHRHPAVPPAVDRRRSTRSGSPGRAS